MKLTGVLFVLALVSPTLTADWWQALTAYEQKNYPVAKAEFEQLVAYGNEDAIFNLGVMYHHGESVAVDTDLALAHFMLAAELGRDDIGELIARLQQSLDAAQLANVETQLQRLRQQVKVASITLEDKDDAEPLPQPIKRIEPRYPVKAAMDGQFGYVALRFLVDEKGNVQTVDVVDAYPEKVFERESIKALKRWKYQASSKKHLFTVRLDFSLGGGVNVSSLEQIVEKNKVWQGALLGSPQHQLVLGSLLRLVDAQSHNTLSIDTQMPISGELDLSVFRPISELRTDFVGFVGRAMVRVAADGTIVEQIHAKFDPSSTINNLKGLKLKGKVETDVYRIVKTPDSPAARAPWVAASFKVPASYSASFWWDKAAKNGNKAAQRILAAYDKRWERYLLEQQDAEVMAWVGSRLLVEGQREQGIALLDAAIVSQYPLAKELKKQLL